MQRFRRTYEDLQQLVSNTGVEGEWYDEGDKKIFCADSGAILNWWPSTGTINYQGPHPAREELDKAVRNAGAKNREKIGADGNVNRVKSLEEENAKLKKQVAELMEQAKPKNPESQKPISISPEEMESMRTRIAESLATGTGLNDWEVSFIRDIDEKLRKMGSLASLTQKQMNKLGAVLNKLLVKSLF